MFTGIIQGQGELYDISNTGSETRFRIHPLFALAPFTKGESIAMNGVCLTVESFSNDWYSVYASAETLSCTNLGALTKSSRVNLERALAVGDHIGGHIVSGHVDCVATVASVRAAGLSRIYTLNFPKEFMPQVVSKGSVTLDGISLTVNHCGDSFLEVNIIPETQTVTTIATWQAGSRVNMETDIIGKYVQHMLLPWQGKDGSATALSKSFEPAGSAGEQHASGITMDFLRQRGF